MRSLCLVAVLAAPGAFHDGPDPVCHWLMTAHAHGEDGKLTARFGPDAEVHGEPELRKGPLGEFVYLDGKEDAYVAGRSRKELGTHLPTRNLTIATWVSVETPQRWGGIVGFVEDNGEAEKGWVLGYDEQRFTFGLASTGADDGDGAMTYLRGRTPYEVGRLYHVVVTYDGKTMSLYVNGVLDGTSTAQSGDVLYPAKTPLAIGAYWDNNERHLHHGRLRDVALYDLCATDKWVAEEFGHGKAMAAAPAERTWPKELEFVVPPYLQFVTQDRVTVAFETSRPAKALVRVGETDQAMQPVSADGEARTLHHVTLDGLKTQMGYVYTVECTDDLDQQLASELRTFQTAVEEATPYAFAIISDTQSNPEVSGRIAQHAFGQRPNFVLIPGDLVGTGGDKSHWTDQFFASMEPLISRCAFFPVLGNHEQNAKHYYDYMALPAPEYYYTFRYGNAQFFVVDSNKKVAPGSEQYRWLERELAQSNATWKFVSFHHPCYSSDENDYGDLWKGKSTHGDLRVRKLTSLFDEHDVDIVWNGHIHSYERTWPMERHQVKPGGTVYMITGGGGGGLETPGPTRPWFQNNVRRGHHYCMVAIAGRRLEFKAFDLENRLFDTLVLEK